MSCGGREQPAGWMSRKLRNGAIEPFLAIAIMLLGSLLVTVNDALIKQALVAADATEVLFFRGLFALFFFLIYAIVTKRSKLFVPQNFPVAFCLSALAVLSLYLFTYSLQFIPLATAIVLAYLSPVFVVVLAPVIARESIGRLQWIAVIISFAGVVLVTSPDFSIREPVIVLPVLVALTIAFRDLIIRRVISNESTLALSVMVHALTVIFSAFAFSPAWLDMELEQGLLYASSGLTVAAGSTAMIAALRFGDVASLSSIKYSCVLWAALFGWSFFGESLSLMTAAGGILIVLGGAFIVRHEHLRIKD